MWSPEEIFSIPELQPITRFITKNKERSIGKEEKGTACFYSAFDELCGMLHDSLPMNLGRAIFITENAFLENTMNYNAFEESLQKRIDLCNWKINELKKKTSDDFTKNAVLYSLMTDTFTVCLPGTEKQRIFVQMKFTDTEILDTSESLYGCENVLGFNVMYCILTVWF